ncbi:YlxR family protein [Synechococcus sp. CS-602]|uniref:YlxR family protein n=1 Tax=Synechococcaceae TaxID=1890426 RepID=UPI0008FF5565|nr:MULTISPECIES: YlxR family protein [Synechococcaceae]MCT4363472.1 YlxR family protein [Candidatus Regnicoccus frigidus MAG-AL1]APD48461.1 DNA-binding protein [Synechococcus sp. SynAce01]MCT0203283.1 YlxR family protein [Synechococcus sp. CS-603]MCT0205237.1 YlxR family protein [Synechococcus sp. CS-602]MCT0246730.1 YlxR family protein [Synechococcus sp. CS-601]
MSGRPILRRCVSCRQLLDRRLLLRVVRLPAKQVVLDEGMGRSAYLCASLECLEEARRRKKLQRALRCQVADSIHTALQQRLEDARAAAAEAR